MENKEYKYIDAHCHLQFEDYDRDREEEIRKTAAEETAAIVVGVDSASSAEAVALAKNHEHIFACVGIHPTYDDPHAKEIEKLVSSPKVVGVGECGLDFFRNSRDENEKRQRDIFEWQIEIALKNNKPLMIHARDSYKEVADILTSKKKEAGEKLRGNMHFFAGDMDDAKVFIDLGFTLSFTGVITFARDYDDVIRFAPISNLLSETDAPYVTPVPFRGKRNNPRFVSEVIRALAKIREENEEEVRAAVFENACRVFGLPLQS